jgi:hypothetical protein
LLNNKRHSGKCRFVISKITKQMPLSILSLIMRPTLCNYAVDEPCL